MEQHREGRFQRYLANDQGLRELLDFLYSECCTQNDVVRIGIGAGGAGGPPRAARGRGLLASFPKPSVEAEKVAVCCG